MYEQSQAFLEWAASYDAGGLDIRSRRLHEQWLGTLPCPIVCVEGEYSIKEQLAMLEAEIWQEVDHQCPRARSLLRKQGALKFEMHRPLALRVHEKLHGGACSMVIGIKGVRSEQRVLGNEGESGRAQHLTRRLQI
jgi:hypothetical protein